MNHWPVASVWCVWVYASWWGAFVCLSRQGLLALGGNLLYDLFVNGLYWAHIQHFISVWSWSLICSLNRSATWVSGNQCRIITEQIHPIHTLPTCMYFCVFSDSLGQPKSLWETFPQVKWDHYHPEMFLCSMKMDRVLEWVSFFMDGTLYRTGRLCSF